MAITFGSYVVPGSEWGRRAAAVAAVAVLTAANLRGISRTAALARVLVALSLAALVIVVAAIVLGDHTSSSHIGSVLPHGGLYGVLQAAGLLFFAFAGYARIATLGEEVRDPARTIPRAIPLALAITVVLYLVVGIAALAAAGPGVLAASHAPVVAAVRAAGAAWSVPVVRIGAAVASLGSLLALIAGIGRTTLAMARNGDLPRALAAVDEHRQVPARAELAVAVVVALLVATTDLRGAIGFSSFGVLLYYAVANASAFSQDAAHRRWPRALNVFGLVGCVSLVATLPVRSVVAGAAVLLVGLGGRAFRDLLRPGSAGTSRGTRRTARPPARSPSSPPRSPGR
jgi:APA family basic amino acid/polyamine antiporter